VKRNTVVIDTLYTIRMMAEGTVQTDELERAGSAATADIVLGIISYNNQDTIASVTRDAQEGLAKFFPLKRGVVVHADGGSKDETPQRALDAALNKGDFLQTTYPVYTAQKISPDDYGVPGKANAVQAIGGIAGELNAAACAIIDCNTSLPGNDWVEALVRPVMERQVDFVSSCYLRDKFEGPILNGILYPLARALYGKRIHQPIGGDYVVSAKLMKYLMTRSQYKHCAGDFSSPRHRSGRACVPSATPRPR
jgi:hypothetical protein